MFTRRAKPIQIIGDPDNQRPDKWSSTVLTAPFQALDLVSDSLPAPFRRRGSFHCYVKITKQRGNAMGSIRQQKFVQKSGCIISREDNLRDI